MLELRRYRRERGLTCEQLAAEFGVSVDSIERYLCGRRAVPGHIVIALVGQGRKAA